MSQPTVTVFEVDLSCDATHLKLIARDAVPTGNGSFRVERGGYTWTPAAVAAARDIRAVMDRAAREIESSKAEALRCAGEQDAESKAVLIASALDPTNKPLSHAAEVIRWRGESTRDEIKRLDRQAENLAALRAAILDTAS